MKPILISLKDLNKNPCEKYYDYIMDNYGKNGLFNPLELINILSKNKYNDVSWLIKNCKFCQTKEMVDFYKSLKPAYDNVSWLIKKCEFCQTKEMVDFYKSLNPKYYNVSWLIFNCKFCQTKEMYEYLETLRSKM